MSDVYTSAREATLMRFSSPYPNRPPESDHPHEMQQQTLHLMFVTSLNLVMV